MIDFEKYVQYSRPAPRYTSYPTAVEFKETSFEEIKPFLQSVKPLSLYIHLPFCKSACYFCGCNVVYTSKEDKKERYIEYLKKEIALWAKEIDTQREVTQLHFGGGTPTFFSADQLKEILRAIKQTFSSFSPDAEISIEIDPRFFNEDQMRVLREEGCNRISFGVQDFYYQTQRTINRVQSFEETKKSVELARRYGIESINIDLIYGLPHQSLETFKETLENVLLLDPDRLAVFNYAHVPWLKKTMRKLDETTLPVAQEKLKILQYTIDFFSKHKYTMIGMDHFAKKEDELFKAIEKGELHRNFQGYTTKGGADLIGLGLTSISETDNVYFQNYKDMKLYEEALDQGRLPTFKGIILTEEDKIRKYVIMELMANFSFDIVRFEKETGVDFYAYFKEEIDSLKLFVDQGLVTLSKEKIVVSQTGTLLIRNIVLPFDSYFKKMQQKSVFSKTI